MRTRAGRLGVLGVAQALACVLLTPILAAQQNAPHAGYVYPAGGRQGTTFEVTVAGQFLNGANNARISGPGVEVMFLEYDRPLTQMQVNTLREQVQEIVGRHTASAQNPKPAPWTPEDQKTVTEIREKIANFVRRTANPVLAETVTLQVTLAADAAPGERDLRVSTSAGMTNPLVFCVGELPEFSKDRAGVARRPLNPARSAANPNQAAIAPPAPPVDIALPTVVNGQMMPGAVDRYRFQAAKGQRLVIAASPRELIPYISDAVPGWFQATLTLRDASGKEVAYADHYRFHPDPILFYEVPSDGQYVLDIKDSIYRGRDDFVYRIAIGELPFLTSVFPLGSKAGAKIRIDLNGWNLPVSKLQNRVRKQEDGRVIEPIAVHNRQYTSNTMPFALETLPEAMEKEPNDQPKNAQRVKLPIIVNGRIDRPGDQDVFRFQGRAGEEIVAEVFARRLDSPLDSVLKLTDASSQELASNDDFEDKGAGLITHQADSRIFFKLPANGTYYLHLGDTQHKGGVEYAYRLRVSHPQPDFELRVVPSSINVRAGSTIPITVYALRRDGFAGDIALKLKDAPSGLVLDGALIPGNRDKVRLTLTAPPARVEKPFGISLEGEASIQGKAVHRPSVPADDMMQAFAYHHLVPEKELLVQVTAAGPRTAQWRPVKNTDVKIAVGGTTEVQLVVPARVAADMQLSLNEPPDGISIQSVKPVPNGVAVVLRAASDKVKPGLKGNLILEAFAVRVLTPPNGKAVHRRQPLGTLPAIPFEVVSGTKVARASASVLEFGHFCVHRRGTGLPTCVSRVADVSDL